MKPNKSFIVKTPLGSGKSVLSDFFVLWCLAHNPGKKVLSIIPYVSLMQEYVKLRSLCGALGFKCVWLGTGYGFNPFDYDVIVCTIERANLLVCEMIKENRLDILTGATIDEAQLLADEARGGLLEILLTKLKMKNVQVLMTTGIVENIEDLAKWMKADQFINDKKSVQIDEYIKAGDKLYYGKSNMLKEIIEEVPNDTMKIVAIVNRAVKKGSVLIFAIYKTICEAI